MKRSLGFTLIELLIVVAIIGILAAIAIPNFLNAQTRAKVSRTVSEMKTVATAFEAYAVDYSKYPINNSEDYVTDWLMIENDNMDHIGRRLTSPVSYLSTIPIDIFNSAWQRSEGYSYWANIMAPGGDADEMYNAWINNEMRPVISWFPHNPEWVIESCGPNLRWWDENNRDANKYVYDPTNGTISDGMISLTNKGWVSPHM